MSQILHHIIRSLLLRIRSNSYLYPPLSQTTDAELAQRIIYDLLTSNSPCMIARFGSVELQAVIDYLYPPSLSNAYRFVKSTIPAWGYAPSTQRAMHINAGFFPSNPHNLNLFGELMIDCMKNVDILGSWRPEEVELEPFISQSIKVPLYSLEPYYFSHNWMPALEGKKVLVIHPFEGTIRKQYPYLKKLFKNPEMAPSYKLITIKAVQSIAGNRPEIFNDWFEALEWMKRQIDEKDFDIAIIGCGAYGFPLAAYVKQIGKKAIHLGGATANLFGIRSNAVDQNIELGKLVNDYWVRASLDETPTGIEKVERARYW